MKKHSPLLKGFIYLLVAMMLFSAIGVMVMYLNVPTAQVTPNEVVIPSDEPTSGDIVIPNEEPVVNTGTTNTGTVIETGSVVETGTVVATGTL